MTGPMGDKHAAGLIGGATGGVGAVLLARPGLVARAVSDEHSRVPSSVVQLLGTRYLVQGAAQLGWPTVTVLRGAAVVDGLHAMTMLAVAWRRADYRRPALVSATVALGSAAVCTLSSRHSSRARP